MKMKSGYKSEKWTQYSKETFSSESMTNKLINYLKHSSICN